MLKMLSLFIYNFLLFSRLFVFRLFSRFLVVASLCIVCTCNKMMTQRPDLAYITNIFSEFTAVTNLKMWSKCKNLRQRLVRFVALIITFPDLSSKNFKPQTEQPDPIEKGEGEVEVFSAKCWDRRSS